jgi:hypothetical protein
VPNVTVVLRIGNKFDLLSAIKLYKCLEIGGKNEKVASILQKVYDISCLIHCISYILKFIC